MRRDAGAGAGMMAAWFDLLTAAWAMLAALMLMLGAAAGIRRHAPLDELVVDILLMVGLVFACWHLAWPILQSFRILTGGI